ncbi:MAG: filamentous hemagglutinin N-terminal domain-containing protein [Nitrospira sp.]
MKTQEYSLVLSGARHTQTSLKPGGNALVLQLMLICMSGAWFANSLAQDGPPITSSGLNTQINLSSPSPVGKIRHDITGGTRAGTNLFHSFGDFNVPDKSIANFLNDTGLPTDNILGRVTGGNISNILGTIQTTGFRNANLFLMNPSGIVFGPNASLNVGGSVTFTTANYLRLSDSVRFNAAINTAADALLSTAPVTAYGFLGSNPSAITIQGSHLTRPEGTSISLVGGNLTIQSSIPTNGPVQSAIVSAPGGHIHLASVASRGEILAGTLEQAPNGDGQSFGRLGTIKILGQSIMDTSGKGGGTVLIRGGQFILDNSRISSNVTSPGSVTNGVDSIGNGIDIALNRDVVIQNNAVIETNVLGDTTPHIQYAGVQIRADHIEIAGTGILSPSSFTGIRSNVGNDAQPSTQGGNSGNITLDANTILIQGLGTLETTVNGASLQPNSASSPSPNSRSGDITLTANQNIELNGSRIQSFISSHSGAAGNITLTSTHGNIVETGNLPPPGFTPTPGVPLPSVTPNMLFAQSRQSTGKAGTVTLNAPEGDIQLAGAQIVLAVQPFPGGPPSQEAGSGQVQLTAKNIKLINGSTVQMDNYSTLPVGDFNVSLTGNLTLNSSRIITTARGSAQAANLNVTAKDVIIQNGATLSTETVSSGHGGHLNITTDTLQLMNGGQLRSGNTIPPQFPDVPPPPVPSGSGGTITVHGHASPTDSVLIDGSQSGVFTNTEGIGPGGTVNISTRSLNIQNGGKLSAETTGISSKATGGSIFVTATDQMSLNNGASITASTSGPGNAGNILVMANDITIRRGSTITASSTGSGNAGTVTIQGLQSPAHSLVIDGANSGVFTKTSNTGAGGDIAFFSKSVQTQNEGKISAETSGSAGTASGGKISVEGDHIYIENGALITSSSTGAGSGGDIALTAGQSVTVQNGASITTHSTGPSNAGNISINAGQQLDVIGSGISRSMITTEAKQAQGGDINIRAIDRVRVVDGAISTSVLGGAGSGGNITIDPKVVVLQNGDILAQANRGTGGDISITTPVFVADQSSRVDASTPFGLNGRITIQSPTSNLSGTIGQLVSKTSPPQVLLQNRCVALAGGEQSTFLLSGREALPSEPGGWLDSPVSVEHWTGEELEHASGLMVRRRDLKTSPHIASQQNKAPMLSLRRMTPPGFLVRTFATGPTGCAS